MRTLSSNYETDKHDQISYTFEMICVNWYHCVPSLLNTSITFYNSVITFKKTQQLQTVFL